MRHGATDAEVQRVVAVIQEMGYRAHPMPGSQRTAVGLVGNDGRVDASRLEGLPGVQEVIQVTRPYKQVSREWKPDSTVVQLGGGVTIGGREVADIIQIGARNMQNFSLLKVAGRAKKPVLLKRGIAATIEELLLSAEYVLSEGNRDVILCERGIRGFDPSTRNVFDLTAIPVVHKLSHLPIIADPSHGTGLRDKVIPMARAAVAAGADGIMVEVHPSPDKALSDGAQSLFPDQFAQLMREVKVIAEVIGRRIEEPASVGA